MVNIINSFYYCELVSILTLAFRSMARDANMAIKSFSSVLGFQGVGINGVNQGCPTCKVLFSSLYPHYCLFYIVFAIQMSAYLHCIKQPVIVLIKAYFHVWINVWLLRVCHMHKLTTWFPQDSKWSFFTPCTFRVLRLWNYTNRSSIKSKNIQTHKYGFA